MLLRISNVPRDYAWGSTTLLAELEGREPSVGPEAELWFGDHPGSPARLEDDLTLDAWLQGSAGSLGVPERLPYLLKLLAAASPLSIQAHPSKQQAEEGFAREEAAGIPRDAPSRTYRDDNHKPELIVAVSAAFTALAGLRPIEQTRRLFDGLGGAGAPVAERLAGTDAAAALRETIAWLLSGDAGAEVDALIAALGGADSDEFDAELVIARRIAAAYPGDPGVVVALLMNLVVLGRGEGLFVPAGVLHAYLEGLGVEIMAASDNVLRGGLTPKHVDVGELVAVLDAGPGPAPVLEPVEIGPGLSRYEVPVADFGLRRALVGEDPVEVPVDGISVVLVVDGWIEAEAAGSNELVELSPGKAALVTPDEGMLLLRGRGEAFIASPGIA